MTNSKQMGVIGATAADKKHSGETKLVRCMFHVPFTNMEGGEEL